ncbi:SoxR reducing system RseC family protein [bacterium]|nr:SoxR reducing system RseC family protein [bacterium]
MAVDSSQIGVVKKYENGEATVLMDVQGGCASCGMHGVCGTQNSCIEHKIKTDIKLEAGDKVIIFIDPAKRIYSALLLFIFPIVNLMIFYFIASRFLSETYSIIIGFVGLVVAFIINRVVDRLWGKKITYMIAAKYEEEEL